MFGGKHRHLIWVDWLLSVVYYRLIWLLVVFTPVVAVYLISLNVYYAWTLTQFAVLLKFLFVIKTRRPVLLRLRESTPLGAWFRDGPVAVLIFLVSQINLWLVVLIRIVVDFGNLCVYI